MGYKELIAALRTEAGEETRKISADSREKSGRILEEAKREAEELRHGPLNEAERDLSGSRAKRFHEARLQAEASVQEAKREVVLRAVKRAGELLEERSTGKDRRRILQLILEEAVEGLDGGTIHVRPRDLKAVKEMASGIDGSFEVAPDKGLPWGVKVVSRDGLVEVDNTFPTRLNRFLALRGFEVAGDLFPD